MVKRGFMEFMNFLDAYTPLYILQSILLCGFGFARRESVRLLIQISGYKSIYTIFENSRKTFLEGVKTHHNPVIRFIATLNSLDDAIV